VPSSLKGSPSETQLLASKLDREAPDVSGADRVAIVRADTAFAFDLYAEVTEGKGNTFLSPYSIAVALSMTYAGAKGATAEQMANVLHIALPAEEMHRARNAVDQAITEPNQTDEEVAGGFEPLRLRVTNSLWGQLGYDFRGQFLDLLARHYGAGMRLVNYRGVPRAEAPSTDGSRKRQSAGSST
jgi:serpin B